METSSPVRLTQQVKAGGCASKLAPGTLRAVLERLPAQHDRNLLVGFETSDDAGIYLIAPDAALVQTVDFFTPLVDDPFAFGQIAAANALSDVYAMGGRPLTALAVVCFPQDGDMDILEQIMRGGLTKMAEAGCILAGGHGMTDITGFGLMGHAREIAMASGVTLEIEVGAVPLIGGALEAVRLGTIPAGLLANRDFAECTIAEASGSHIPDELRTLMFDPQTSGPLLISVAAENSELLCKALRGAGLAVERIGRVADIYSPESGNPAIVLQ